MVLKLQAEVRETRATLIEARAALDQFKAGLAGPISKAAVLETHVESAAAEVGVL